MAYKVFLVDDEVAIREGIRNSKIWQDERFTLVGEAPDGEIALSMIADERPDILLTDIRMPFLDGFELIKNAKSMMPWLKVVIISGLTGSVSEMNGRKTSGAVWPEPTGSCAKS